MADETAAAVRYEGVAHGPAMRALLEDARRVARAPRPVLVRGERGSGKELLARYLHAESPRADGPFVAVNCAALSDSLLNAELYGHEKGAYTGADASRPGRLELANGGTLFLDEIGNMSRIFQEMILRALEYRTFERVRGRETLHVDFRVVSATNANLEELMAEGLFRRDLYDRLTFAELTVPPLRKRREDIPRLIVHFVRRLHEEIPNLPRRAFAEATVAAMIEHHWPGNVRELKNAVERAYLYGTGEEILPDELPPVIAGSRLSAFAAHRPESPGLNKGFREPNAGRREPEGSFHEQVEAFQRRILQEALDAENHSQRAAAARLGMTYDQFRHYYRRFARPRPRPELVTGGVPSLPP